MLSMPTSPVTLLISVVYIFFHFLSFFGFVRGLYFVLDVFKRIKIQDQGNQEISLVLSFLFAILLTSTSIISFLDLALVLFAIFFF